MSVAKVPSAKGHLEEKKMIFLLQDALSTLFSLENEFSSELFPITWELIPTSLDFTTDYLGLHCDEARGNLNQLGLHLCYQADLPHKTTYQSNIAPNSC